MQQYPCQRLTCIRRPMRDRSLRWSPWWMTRLKSAASVTRTSHASPALTTDALRCTPCVTCNASQGAFLSLMAMSGSLFAAGQMHKPAALRWVLVVFILSQQSAPSTLQIPAAVVKGCSTSSASAVIEWKSCTPCSISMLKAHQQSTRQAAKGN